jgi:hypothetical protein
VGDSRSTHQYDEGDEDEVREEIARLGEAGGLQLKLASICVEEVWVQDHAQLGTCEDEGRNEPPQLRQAAQREDLVRDPYDVVRVNEAHPCRY